VSNWAAKGFQSKLEEKLDACYNEIEKAAKWYLATMML
jgi:hypothetical protein